MVHKLVYRPRAAEDLESIYRFIAQDSPARAFGYIGKIQGRCDLLCDSPEQGRARSDLRSGLRVIPKGRPYATSIRGGAALVAALLQQIPIAPCGARAPTRGAPTRYRSL